MLLLIAAAEPSGDPLVFWRAVDLLGVSRDAAGALQEAGLLCVGSSVVFRHPLVRSASYRFASVDARRSVHRALSERDTRRSIPTGEPYIGRWPPRVSTRRSRWSWSAQPTAP